jgi:glutamate 5-kinase
MITKLNAARICMENNVDLVVANGNDMGNIEKIINGKAIGTLFAGGVE